MSSDYLSQVNQANQVSFIMLSPSRYSRLPPPMRPSRSLDGLEQVIPPAASNYSTSRTDLQLNKPLPAHPLAQSPALPGRSSRSAWSDDSSVESFGDPTDQSQDSTEAYPIFVSSGSDDFDEIVDQPTDALPAGESTAEGPPDISSSLALKAFLSEERYGSHTFQNRVGSSHYFREKKWDFFPELATPSVQGSSALSAAARNSNQRKRDKKLSLGFDFGRGRNRWHSDNGGLAIAHGVRDSIRSYVNRTLSKSDDKPNKTPEIRPVTATGVYSSSKHPTVKATSLSDRSFAPSASRENSLDTSDHMGSLSFSTSSSLNDEEDHPPRRQKQLAVPISPYQKYGPSIWDKSGRKKRVSYRQGHHVRFPKYQNAKRTHESSRYANSAPTLASPLHQLPSRNNVKAVHHGSSHVWDALDDAKRRMAEFKADRKRAQLKAQIKLVGPVNPFEQKDPWM